MHMLTPRLATWIEFALATPVVLWCGWPFFARGWASIKFRSPNMFTLIAMGVGVAYVYSAVATLLPGIFPPSMRAMGGQRTCTSRQRRRSSYSSCWARFWS